LKVQSGGSFDIDYTVVGPNDKVIMANTKERQGDFVFTAQEAGEYRVCFNNEMSTFAEKMVDFEIAVRPPSQTPLNPQLTPSLSLGGERTTHHPPPKTRHDARTNLRARRIHLQDLRPTLNYKPQPKILPHAGEPEF
jgi:hypothetical protein